MKATLIAAILFLTPVSVVLAQPQVPRPGTREYREWEMQRQQAKPEAWSVSGKIHSFNLRAGEINVLADDGRPWRVKLSKDTPVSVKGEGGVDALKPRVAVRFYAPITKRKVLAEPLTQLTMFTPRPPFEPTVEPTTEEEARAAMSEGDEEDEAKAPAELDPLEDGDEPTLQERINREKKPASRGGRKQVADDEEVETEWYHVTGILVSAKKGKFVVDAGEAGRIRGEIADDAEVEADLLGIQFASPGDMIQAKGQTNPAEQMSAVATSVDVTLAEKPSESEERPRRGRSRRGDPAQQQPFGPLGGLP